MSGIAIVGELLRGHAPLLAKVAVENIKAGALPEDAPLPSILLRTVSATDRQPLKRGNLVRVTERVGATVRARDYREQRAIIRLIRAAAAGKIVETAPGQRATVLTAGLGPDVMGPGNSFEQTQDFKTSHDEPA